MSRILTLFLLMPALAWAQTKAELPVGFGADGPAGSCQSMLLQMRDVHTELAFSEGQLLRLASLLTEHQGERRKLLDNLLAGRVFETPVSDQDIRDILAEHSREFERRLAAQLLSSSQAKRLRELSLQLKGLSSSYEPHVGRALRLSPEQRSQLTSIRSRLSPQAGTRTVQEADKILKATLSSPQIARLQGMQGEQFEFRALQNHLARKRESSKAIMLKSLHTKYAKAKN